MRYIGKRVPRNDGEAKVRGKAIFVSDIYLPHMIYASIVRSPYPYAKIKGVQKSKALKIKGVLDVITASDIPGENVIPVVWRDMPALAEEFVRYNGEAVAIVAAKTKEIADRGAKSVFVDYEPLPPCLCPILSMEGKPSIIYGNNNIYKHWKIRKGDVENAFLKADIILENTYETSYQEHSYLEPQGMIAIPLEDGGIEIRGSMQCPFYVREAVALTLNLPYSKVRVIQTVTGGGFGGKEDVPSIVAVQAALPAFRLKRPTKVIYSREEDIISMSKRHPAIIKIKNAVTKEGKLIAGEVTYILDAGAYSTLSPVVAWRGTVHSLGPYRYENVKVDTYAVATNKVPCGAFRGFGSPQILFAVESQMDEIANKLQICPYEFRKMNILREGDITITGQKLKDDVGLLETIEKAMKESRWDEKRKEYKKYNGRFRRGIGCSTLHYGVCLGAGGKHLDRAGAFVQLMYDGSATYAVGTTEMGQGMHTVLSQIVAEELGVEYEKVYPMASDTHIVPDSGPTVASRSTLMSGNALREACKTIRKELIEAAGNILGVNPQMIEYKEGWFLLNNEKKLHLSDVLKKVFSERRHLASSGWFVSPPTSWDEEEGQGDAYITYSYATNVSEVEVDTLTGEVNVLKITAAHDMGKAINPSGVEGQIEGGALQGMGFSLMEEIVMENGKIINPDFSTYIIPTSKDAPLIKAIITEHPFRDGPYGAKGFGELPLMGVAPAICNAIFDATGVRIKKIPAKPEIILELLKNRRDKNE